MKQKGKSADVAQVFLLHGQKFLEENNLSWQQKDIIKDIMTCRTIFLGGHREQCDACGHQQNVFISCRNRHCPKCQATIKVKWLQARKSELLPLSYFHLVFTLPHEINLVALCNKNVIGNILFQAVSKTLLEFGSSTRNRLGGKVGFISILHTWDQKLLTHFHLHCLIPAAALSKDGTRLIECNKKYLFPVKALSKVFRGKFMAGLDREYKKEKLQFPGKTEQYRTAEGFEKLSKTLWSKKWIVFAKPALNEPGKILEYLGRYVHRVAISNYRIVEVNHETVCFTYKDRKNNIEKTMELPAREFIRRFLLHTLPKQFMRIRSYGFLANRSKKEDLKRCRELLGVTSDPSPSPKSTVELIGEMLGFDITKCPCCKKGTMQIIKNISPIMDNLKIDDLFTEPCCYDTS